jgi:hypothetical protein
LPHRAVNGPVVPGCGGVAEVELGHAGSPS